MYHGGDNAERDVATKGAYVRESLPKPDGDPEEKPGDIADGTMSPKPRVRRLVNKIHTAILTDGDPLTDETQQSSLLVHPFNGAGLATWSIIVRSQERGA